MEFRSCINYLLTTAQQRVNQQIVALLGPYELTTGQYGILNHLWEVGQTTPKELAQILHLETSTISGLLDRLQKKELIDRLVDANDRRSVQVVPTELSLALREQVVGCVDQLNSVVLEDIAPEKRDILLECLRTIGHVD